MPPHISFRFQPVPAWLCAGFILASLALAGCDLFGEEGPGEERRPLPDGAVLVALTDGKEPALWLFDPVTLERTAVLETENRAPKGVAFSPDYERWYLSWSTGSQLDGDARNVLAALDPASESIVKRTSTPDLSVGGYQLIYEPLNDHVVAYGNGSGHVQLFDSETLERVRELAIGGGRSYVPAAALAEGRGKIYFGANTEAHDQIYVYDVAEQAIDRAFPLIDDPVLQRSALSDVALSPDERYLYATTFLSPGGPGRFFMVDLETGETVFEGRAGGYSNLAVGPGGRYVYIDCPAGGAYRQLIPMGQVLRFDAEQRTMEVFIEGSEALGLGDYILEATQITMLPNGEAFVLRNRNAALAEDPALIKVDAETGSVLATYAPPYDDRGYPAGWVRELHFGIAPK